MKKTLVKLQLRYVYYRFQLWQVYYKIRVRIIKTTAWFIQVSPWYRAYLRAAMVKYEESLLYRLRATEFGDEWAFQHFTDNLKHELPMFKWHVRKDKKLMARIVLAPFSVYFRTAN
jgi:hypothetical protein